MPLKNSAETGKGHASNNMFSNFDLNQIKIILEG